MKTQYFYRINDVSRIIGLSRSAIYKLVRISKFPKPIKITPKCSVWSCDQIEAWIENRKLDSMDTDQPISKGDSK